MSLNSQLGVSGALSNGPTITRIPLVQHYDHTSPPTTFLQRRRENWLEIKNNFWPMLEMVAFLGLVIDDGIILPWKMKRRRKRVMNERRRNEPYPLPKRRRALSTTYLDLSQTSALLSLPREIRLQIYSHLIGYDLLHLVQLPKRLGHIRCHNPSPYDFVGFEMDTDTDLFWDIKRECQNMRPHNTKVPQGPYAYGEHLRTKGTSDNSLSLLQTSRQMYIEASHILYTTNTFDIDHPQTLLFLHQTLLPHRLASIKYLQIKWYVPRNFHSKRRVGRTEPDTVATWDKMCEIVLTKMTGLRHVRLVYTSLHEALDGCLPLVFKLQCEERLASLETFELAEFHWRGTGQLDRVPDGF